MGSSNKSDETRKAILEAAREVFVDDGFERASMRRVAQRAGITHGTIYLHFRDKDDLFYQVSEEQFRVLLERLRGLPRTLDPVSRTMAALRTFVEYGLDYPNHYALLFAMPVAWRGGRVERRFGPMASEVYSYLREALSRAQSRGLLQVRDADQDTMALLAALHGVVELFRSEVTTRDDALACSDRLLQLLLAGLSADATVVRATA
jgi:AcrR family transcriptional regulator